MTQDPYPPSSIPSTVAPAIDFIEQALLDSDVFFGHGCLDAYDEAVYLVLFTLELPLDDLDPHLDKVLSPQQKETLSHFIQERITKHTPIPYLTQEAWLMGRRFYVDERVLIPRSLIAELLPETILSLCQSEDNIHHILDMCTGSACLAIIAAEEFPQAQVDAVDISAEALEVAQINVHHYGLSSDIKLYQSDLFAQLPAKQYDLIICNPPYVNQGTMDQLPAEYLHEPQIALAGGQDGMTLIKRLFKDITSYLSPHGLLILEIGNEKEHFERAFPNLTPVWLSCSAGDEQVLMLSAQALKSISL